MPRPIVDLARRARASVGDGQLFGMEIEAEGLSPGEALDRVWPSGTLRNWAIVEDGSLRQGLEFVSLPLTLPSLTQAIRNLYNGAFGEGRPMRGSVRTGIHIHASCLFMDTDRVLRICQHYALLEPLLFSMVGNHREENIYCIPWYRALDTPAAVYSALQGTGDQPELCKYSALHVAPLFRYGTLEYRHAPTFDTAEQVIEWLQTIASLHATWATDYDVLDEWRRLGPHEFASRVLQRGDLTWRREWDDLDLERVCELLRPKKDVVHDGWGVPPTLRTPGSIMVLPGANVPGLPPRLTARPRRARIPMPTPFLRELEPRERPATAEVQIDRNISDRWPLLAGSPLPPTPEPEEPLDPPEEQEEEYDGPEYEPEWDEPDEFLEEQP